MNKWIVAIAVATLAIGGAAAPKLRASGATSETPTFETACVQRTLLRQTVQCTGSVVSNLDVEIKCEASGKVLSVPFDVSDCVKRGDLLLELDPENQERTLQQCQASMAASKAQMEEAKAR